MPQIDCVIGRLAQPAPTTMGSNSDAYRMNCERCGSYEASQWAAAWLTERLSQELRPIFSEWVYEKNRLGEVPFISKDDLLVISGRRKLSFVEKTRRFLLYLAEKTPNPGMPVEIRSLRIEALLQTNYQGLVDMIVEYLKEEGLVVYNLRPGALLTNIVALTPKGIMQAEEWGRGYTISTQGFVAMWFSDEMTVAWEKGFYPAIDKAGYTPRRIDTKEHINKICDEIIAEIRRSRFVVADFTGQRGGVYYEAGYASGREIPVIWTCRKDEISKLHFDMRQYNYIDWTTPAELAHRLQVRIEAVIGEGPQKQSRRLVRPSASAC
jgi:hypothetical protein